MSAEVVLLHGLGRTGWSMSLVARALARRGFHPVNINYPSMRYPLEELSARLGRSLHQRCNLEETIHFVTHSLGGILVRHYLKGAPLENLGRVVMLSPPNQGSELVDRFRDRMLFRLVVGPVGAQLGIDPLSLPNTLGPVDYEVGIIAGNRSLNPLLSRILPGEDDGRVAVESTKLAGMADFLVVPAYHSFIMFDKGVIEQVTSFLETGKFIKPA